MVIKISFRVSKTGSLVQRYIIVILTKVIISKTIILLKASKKTVIIRVVRIIRIIITIYVIVKNLSITNIFLPKILKFTLPLLL